MDFESMPVVALLAMAVSLFTLLRNERMQHRTRKAERFQLQQAVRLSSEAARSGWYALIRETDTLTDRLAINRDLHPGLRTIMSDFLQGWKEFLSNCAADASAVADDAFENGASFNEEKCRELLTAIEVSIEKVRRNQGEADRRIGLLMEKATAHSATM